MTQSRPFDDILDECLERLFSADGTVEQCLEAYPEHAAELAPLLRTAVATRRAVSVEPNTDFKARARYQFLAEVDRRHTGFRWPRLGWQPRWAMVGLVALVIVIISSGTVVAADSSMPGSVLYPVKLATERVRLAMTFSDLGRAELLARWTDRRVTEIDYAMARGRPEQVEQVTERLMKHLGRLSDLSLAEVTPADRPSLMTPERTPDRFALETAPSSVGGIEADGGGRAVAAPGNGRARLRSLVEAHRQRHPARLREALERAPESARSLLRRAITASENSYDKVLEELEPTEGEPPETDGGTNLSPAGPRRR